MLCIVRHTIAKIAVDLESKTLKSKQRERSARQDLDALLQKHTDLDRVIRFRAAS